MIAAGFVSSFKVVSFPPMFQTILLHASLTLARSLGGLLFVRASEGWFIYYLPMEHGWPYAALSPRGPNH